MRQRKEDWFKMYERDSAAIAGSKDEGRGHESREYRWFLKAGKGKKMPQSLRKDYSSADTLILTQ